MHGRYLHERAVPPTPAIQYTHGPDAVRRSYEPRTASPVGRSNNWSVTNPYVPSLRVCKKQLYISLVRSQLLYCSQVWRPCLIQDILLLERVQRRATKYILNDYTSSYRTRLLKLSMLPLMYIFELNDLLFFIKSMKNPSPHFDITKWIHLNTNVTRSSTHLKLVHNRTKYNSSHHFYFNRLPRLWNSLPPINLELSTETIKHQLNNTFWTIFTSNFDSNNFCTYHVKCPCSRCNLTPITPLFN